MKAARANEFGGPDVIRVVDLPTPSPGPGQVLVRVEAAGVNFIDVYMRSGLYKGSLPVLLGKEGAGTVEAVGAGVSDVQPGDRVAWASVNGSYATHLIAPASALVKVPDAIDSRRAAAAMLQGMTAHYLAKSTFELGPGHTCVVHAAAGGVGLLLCQLAASAGAHVIGTVSTKEKAALARGAGARDVIIYTEEDFEQAVRAIAPDGVDVVYDAVGKTTFDKSLACLRTRGLLVSYGQSSGPVPPIDVLKLKHGAKYLTRPSLEHYTETREELVARAGELLSLIGSGALNIRIHDALSLERAADAHRMLESRETTGKVLLLPG
ncbi:MAG: quinone oxidoreductase [Polyangiaceae bacterium]|nr:quinone oxidoreductase [Polyangiaceae bacterium]